MDVYIGNWNMGGCLVLHLLPSYIYRSRRQSWKRSCPLLSTTTSACVNVLEFMLQAVFQWMILHYTKGPCIGSPMHAFTLDVCINFCPGIKRVFGSVPSQPLQRNNSQSLYQPFSLFILYIYFFFESQWSCCLCAYHGI